MGWSRHLLACATFAGWATATSHAQSHLTVNIIDGRVTLFAQNVTLRAILQEWTRANGATIGGGERLDDIPMTVQLTDLSERDALATILRGLGGYVVTLRADGTGIDRILVLPNRGPANDPAKTGEQVVRNAPEQATLTATDRSSTATGAGSVAVRDLATSAGADSGSPSADVQDRAAAQQHSTAVARVNSSDSITEY